MNFFVPLSGLLTGILAGMLGMNFLYGAIFCLLAMLFYFILIKIVRNPLKTYKLASLHYLWILLLFCGIGIIDLDLNRPHYFNDDELGSEITIQGIVKDVKTKSSGERLTVEVDKIISQSHKSDYYRNLNIIIQTNGFSTTTGDEIAGIVKLQKLEDKNSHNNIKKPFDFSYKINYISYTDFQNLEVTGRPFSITGLAKDIRNFLEIKIENSCLQRDVQEFMISIVLGDKDFLSQDILESFNDTGVAHILALSGLHIAIISGIFLMLFYPFQIIGQRKTRYLLTIVCIWLYTFISGASWPTIRAAIMASFVIIALLTQRKNSSMNSLLGAALIILLIDPFSISDVGLQLSLLSVAAIITFANLLNPVERHARPYLYAFCSSIIVALTATTATWALISHYFKRIPLLFLPSNLFLLPLLPAFIFISLLYILLLVLGLDLRPLAFCIEIYYEVMLSIINFISDISVSSIFFQTSFVTTFLWSIGIILLIVTFNIKYNVFAKRIAGGVSAGCLCLSLCFLFLPSHSQDVITVEKGSRNFIISVDSKGEYNKYEIPRWKNSIFTYNDINIICLDSTSGNIIKMLDIPSDNSTNNLLSDGGMSKGRNFLIIGSGSETGYLKEFIQKYNFEGIILHNSIMKKREKELLQELGKEKNSNIHSLRYDGTLEILCN